MQHIHYCTVHQLQVIYDDGCIIHYSMGTVKNIMAGKRFELEPVAQVLQSKPLRGHKAIFKGMVEMDILENYYLFFLPKSHFLI